MSQKYLNQDTYMPKLEVFKFRPIQIKTANRSKEKTKTAQFE